MNRQKLLFYKIVGVTITTIAVCFGLLTIETIYRSVHSRLTPVTSAHHSIDSEHLSAGMVFPMIKGHTLSGQPMTLDFVGITQPTLVLILSPACPYCRVNFHNWRSILASHPEIRVVWVDLTDTADSHYLDLMGIAHDDKFICLNTESTPKAIVSTPTTVLVDATGIVRWTWAGVLGIVQMKDVQKQLANMKISLRNGEHVN